jgi:two-component system, OmpR family, alkaline phosphatase synthesis response regulator PhoP
MNNSDPKLIMVVEDEKLLLSAIETKLIANGYHVIPCISAEEAISSLQEAVSMPAGIWLDYYLGGMDANGFVKQLKSDEKTAHIPIIIVSNSASEEKKKEMLDLGVKRYVLKAQYKLDDIITILEEEMKTQPSL